MAADTYDLEYGEPLSDADLVDYFWSIFPASKDHFDPIWEESETLYKTYYGDTLSEQDATWLIETKRPPISFNFVSGTIDTIVGSDMADRKEVVFRGADMSDFDGIKAEWITRILRHQMNKTKALRHQSDAFFDMLITGYGFAEVFLDSSKIPVPVALKRVQPWEMFPDPDATEDNLTDARFMIRVRKWMVEEVQARWPKMAREVADAITTNQVPTTTPKPSISGHWKEVASPTLRKGVTVYHLVYRRYEPRVAFEDPETGEIVKMRPREFEERQDQAQAAFQAAMEQWSSMPTIEPPPSPDDFLVAEYEEFPSETFYSAHLLGNKEEGNGIVLEHRELSVPMFPYRCVTGYKLKDTTENRVRFFGPAKKIYDPQLYLNKSLQVWLDILARGSKGGGFINRELVKGNEGKFIKEQSIPGMWHVVDGEVTAENLQFKPVQPTPSGYENFLNLCMDAISRVSLVTDWVKGTAQQERSNVLISNLQQQAMTGLNPLFDPLAQFREECGTLVAKLMLKHLPDRDLNRMLGEVEPVEGLTHEMAPDPETGEASLQPIMVQDEGGEMRPVTPADLLRQVDPFEYDIAVDVGQASSTQKQSVWQIFIQTGLLQQLIEMGVPMETILPQLIRYLPLPSTMAKKMADELEEQMEQAQAMRTEEGLIEALAQMPPEEQIRILEAAAQVQGGNAAVQ